MRPKAGSSAQPAPIPANDLLGSVAELNELIRLYALEELIFCGQDVPAGQTMSLMQAVRGPAVSFKILPENSQYIIGSSSKDAPGDYYALNPTLRLHQPAQVRAKRLLDVLLSLGLLGLAPLLLGFQGPGQKTGFLRNAWRVLTGGRHWVGLRYAASAGNNGPAAILSPADAADTARTALQNHPAPGWNCCTPKTTSPKWTCASLPAAGAS